MEKDFLKEYFLQRMALDDYCDRLKEEFDLSKSAIAKLLREKAQELAPRKTTKKVTIPTEFIQDFIKRKESDSK